MKGFLSKKDQLRKPYVQEITFFDLLFVFLGLFPGSTVPLLALNSFISSYAVLRGIPHNNETLGTERPHFLFGADKALNLVLSIFLVFFFLTGLWIRVPFLRQEHRQPHLSSSLSSGI